MSLKESRDRHLYLQKRQVLPTCNIGDSQEMPEKAQRAARTGQNGLGVGWSGDGSDGRWAPGSFWGIEMF